MVCERKYKNFFLSNHIFPPETLFFTYYFDKRAEDVFFYYFCRNLFYLDRNDNFHYLSDSSGCRLFHLRHLPRTDLLRIGRQSGAVFHMLRRCGLRADASLADFSHPTAQHRRPRPHFRCGHGSGIRTRGFSLDYVRRHILRCDARLRVRSNIGEKQWSLAARDNRQVSGFGRQTVHAHILRCTHGAGRCGVHVPARGNHSRPHSWTTTS